MKSSFSVTKQSKLPHYVITQKLKDLESYEQQVNDLSEQNLDMIDDINQLDGLSNELPSKNMSTLKVNLDQKQIEKSQNQEML